MISFRRIFSGGYAGDTLISIISTVVARILALIAIMLMTRVFEPGVYGLWVLVLSFAAFFAPLANLRLDVPLVMTKDSNYDFGLLRIIFTMTLVCMTVLLGLGIFLKGGSLTTLVGLPDSKASLLLLSPIVLLLLSLQMVGQSLLLKTRDFKKLGLTSILIPIVAIALTFVFAKTGHRGAAAVTFIFIVSQSAGLMVSLFPFHRLILRGIDIRSGWNTARDALRHFAVYPKYTLPFSISVTLTERLVQISLAKFYTLEVLASFFLARQLTSGVTSVIAGALRSSFFAHSASYSKSAELEGRVLSLIRFTTYLATAAMAFGVFWAEPIVRIIAGSNWENLGAFAKLCVVPAFVLVVTGPLDRIFDLTGRQVLSVWLQVGSDVTTVLVVIMAVALGWPVYWVVGSLCAMITLYNLVWLACALTVAGVPFRKIGFVLLRLAVLLGLNFLLQYSTTFIPSTLASFTGAVLVLIIGMLPVLLVLRAFANFPDSHWTNKVFAHLARFP
jgi:O-antigen/teichoic acid export membrane protein